MKVCRDSVLLLPAAFACLLAGACGGGGASPADGSGPADRPDAGGAADQPGKTEQGDTAGPADGADAGDGGGAGGGGGTGGAGGSGPIPFGINNPFQLAEVTDPEAKAQLDGVRDLGVNLVSQHAGRRYAKGEPDFDEHQRQIDLFIKGSGMHFWVVIHPKSERGFVGDIDVDAHRVIGSKAELADAIDQKHKFAPNSDEGFAEWKAWLGQLFDVFDKSPGTIEKLPYVQIGNEVENEYMKPKPKLDDPNSYFWEAYAKAIQHAYSIIRSRAPKARIVIGAMAGSNVAVEGFQRPLLKYLYDGGIRSCGGTGCFDVYDYHDFSPLEEYQGRVAEKDGIVVKKTPEFFIKLLDETGFPDKALVVQQGATHSGQETMDERSAALQSELDQAAYLVKRAIYRMATRRYEQIQWGPHEEHAGWDGSIHNFFTLTGLVYNGVPKAGACGGQLPCPDPGKGIRKLSWYAFKKLVGVLGGSDWEKTETLLDGKDNVYAYKFVTKAGGKPVYVAWWDYFREPAAASRSVGLAVAGKSVNLTEAVPAAESGTMLTRDDYAKAFKTESKPVEGGTVMLTLGKRPVYLEAGE